MIENGPNMSDGVAAAQIRSLEPPPGAGPNGHAGSGLSMDAVMTIPVMVQIVLGATTMPVADLMKLSRGAVLALDHKVGEPVDIVVNGRVVARGDLVVMDDDHSRFGVSLTEIVGSGAARVVG